MPFNAEAPGVNTGERKGFLYGRKGAKSQRFFFLFLIQKLSVLCEFFAAFAFKCIAFKCIYRKVLLNNQPGGEDCQAPDKDQPEKGSEKVGFKHGFLAGFTIRNWNRFRHFPSPRQLFTGRKRVIPDLTKSSRILLWITRLRYLPGL